MVTRQQPGTLHGQPALGLEIGALRTGAMPTRVVPDARHMAVRTGLDMAAERGRAALHDGARRAPDVGGKRMGLLVGRIRVLKNGVQRHERQRSRPSGDGPSMSGFFFYRITPTIPTDSGYSNTLLSDTDVAISIITRYDA